ncbi:MAG: DUF3082 domain-containing protein [Acaryochloridaceae cyanobacterium RL_2_7]|nr:DUF3082 domain-containing protein [Acaryochloridaceae cyanobacterium RL_2_7]
MAPDSEQHDSAETLTQTDENKKETTTLRAWSGALMSGTIAMVMYKLTYSIAYSYATHPSVSSSQVAQRISAAVRTLVVGLSTMATGLFAIATLGLFLLGIKLLLERKIETEN